jgi:predicted transcriptional regulator YdeE
MILVGFSFFGDPFQVSGSWTEENEIGRTWKRFIAYLQKNRPDLKHVVSETVMYEVHVYHEETLQTGEFEVFVGLQVDRLEDVPYEMTVKALPPATYAIFTLEGEQLASDWHMSIFSDWLPRTEYQGLHTHCIQRYDERFKGVHRMAESALDVYIPVEKRGVEEA